MWKHKRNKAFKPQYHRLHDLVPEFVDMGLMGTDRLEQGGSPPEEFLKHEPLQLWHVLRRRDRFIKEADQRRLEVLQGGAVPHRVIYKMQPDLAYKAIYEGIRFFMKQFHKNKRLILVPGLPQKLQNQIPGLF